MSLSELVPPKKRLTISADVYEQFKELLMTGRMMPGEQLSLRTVAAALGVSVMPVREAMQRLVAEQALELSPNRAMRVPTMTVSQFREITSIRINLEGVATERAAKSLSETELRRIVQLNEDFFEEMASASPNGARLITLNKEFHFAVYEGSRMPMLLQLIKALWVRIGPILNHDLRAGSARINERVAVSHHSQLVDALRRRDSEAARIALQGDIDSAAQFIISAHVLVIADSTNQST
ncbi:MAG: DNA-binding GntR family transcriptional regulator [Burkholderiaceae bacterium]|jgi:DNA-binding GntR family transcriptional regulator